MLLVNGQFVVLCISQLKEWSVFPYPVVKGPKQVTYTVLFSYIKFSLSHGLLQCFGVPGICRTGGP